MKIEVVIPAAGDPSDLLWSLTQQSRLPDLVTVVSNGSWGLAYHYPMPIRRLSFTSEEYPYGFRDVVLRRNIGIWESKADFIIFQDDDQVAPRHMVRDFANLFEVDNVVWGHHRFIDFDEYSPEVLLGLPPEAGKPREDPPNHQHLYQSGFAGCFGARRETLLGVGGFDMLFLGRHGNEDQNLARRLCGTHIYVHEPPFSWHPTKPVHRDAGPSNVCGSHDWEPHIQNEIVFTKCSRCPLWKFSDRQEHLFRDEVVVPYEHQLVHVVTEAL